MHDFLTYTPASDTSDPDYPGLFIAFEGGDGAGKSTQIRLLAEELTQRGHRVVLTREPGGTDIGEALRTLLLGHGHGTIDARTEALMMAASRAAHVHQKIIPALKDGAVVLCDRYIDSSAAYQGAGRELGTETITQLNLWATENLLPHLTVLIDVPLGAGRARTQARGAADRMETEPDSFHSRVHETFARLAQEAPSGYAVINGQGSIEEVASAILEATLPYLKDRV